MKVCDLDLIYDKVNLVPKCFFKRKDVTLLCNLCNPFDPKGISIPFLGLYTRILPFNSEIFSKTALPIKANLHIERSRVWRTTVCFWYLVDMI